MRNLIALAVVTLLAACAAEQQSQVTAAVATPVSDLNLVHAPIPELLQVASKAPYQVPGDQTCESLAQIIKSLDEVLGADLDTPPTASNPGLVERGTNTVGQAAVGAVQRTAEGLVPFRGWIRKLSGAERYSRQVSAAIAAGTARRAFIKGIAAARNCK